MFYSVLAGLSCTYCVRLTFKPNFSEGSFNISSIIYCTFCIDIKLDLIGIFFCHWRCRRNFIHVKVIRKKCGKVIAMICIHSWLILIQVAQSRGKYVFMRNELSRTRGSPIYYETLENVLADLGLAANSEN